MLDILREMTGSGMLHGPSSYRDYHNAEIAPDVERFIRSGDLTSVERAKLFRLAWDLVGSEFAGRHAQYELFYAGSRSTTTSLRIYRNFDFAAANALVDRCLASYDLPPAGS
jgi:4-hydroxyphenylacetate 3-monooxygenase